MKNLLKYIVLSMLSVVMVSCEDGDIGFEFDDQDVSTSGSIAKFYIDQTHLYVIEENSLSVFDITDFENMQVKAQVDINREVETIFRLGDVLYLGTTTGVLFYDISDPNLPSYLSSYNHFTGCDPVVSDGQYAYTTLRSNAGCGGGTNVLDVVDMSNLDNPVLVKSYEVASPYGLVLFDDYLFLAQGSNGMKVFDISDVSNAIEVGAYSDIKALDFIRDGQNIIIRTESGITQIAVNADASFSVLSQINY
ncbi:hypothetical protein N6H18_13225 [Reichenbachiella agarivorans]|uniref:LVIVD repeat-containing protein n=1 Tax=Reichenbachiella agarivorans TaxID=2979464 RepID=A0ABY6CLB2_9BACT|nr:hypothetical protein [Reichenbachiella agarivorans]UXP31310.1 hypothetical protein N6H18_13225 [Reichenbachiella agarivorans]